MQLIRIFMDIWHDERLPLWMQPYQVLPTSHQTALIELLPNAVSVHSIKRCLPPGTTLADHFFKLFPRGTPECRQAQGAFAESLAAYSLVCYLLQIKDRHNANILLDLEVLSALCAVCTHPACRWLAAFAAAALCRALGVIGALHPS